MWTNSSCQHQRRSHLPVKYLDLCLLKYSEHFPLHCRALRLFSACDFFPFYSSLWCSEDKASDIALSQGN